MTNKIRSLSLSAAVLTCFAAPAFAANPVHQAPEGFNFNEVGEFSKDLGASCAIEVRDYFDDVHGYWGGQRFTPAATTRRPIRPRFF